MKKFASILLAATSFVGTVGAASAQYYERGPDYVVPAPGPYYGPGPDYGPGPYYRHRYRERYYDEDRRYFPPNPRWRTWNGCPPRYTVQDGLCKPYRGY